MRELDGGCIQYKTRCLLCARVHGNSAGTDCLFDT